MGYFVVMIITLVFLFFLVKKISSLKNAQGTKEIYGEIITLKKETKEIILQTKEGQLLLKVNPKVFLTLGEKMRGIATLKENTLLHFEALESHDPL